MRIKILLVLTLILQAFSAQSQQFNWAAAATGEGYEYGIKTTRDTAGNTYIIGHSVGEVNSSQYPKGIYLVKISTDKGIALKKVILE